MKKYFTLNNKRKKKMKKYDKINEIKRLARMYKSKPPVVFKSKKYKKPKYKEDYRNEY